MIRLFKVLDLYIIPGMLILIWVELYFTSGVKGVGSAGMGLGFLAVLFLYWIYRQLRVHASASRMAAVGDAAELIELSDREIVRKMSARTRLPFRIYRAIGLEQRGDHAAARQALDELDLTTISTSRRRTWGTIVASTRIQIAVAEDDAATARKIYDTQLAPVLAGVGGAGAAVLFGEAEALVLYAEHDYDRARPIFEKLAKDIRISSATRALCKHYLGRIADDPKLLAEAAKLAPKTWLAQNAPTSASPAPSPET